MLLGKPLARVTPEDVEDLITNKVRENRHLDYKRQLPGGSESDKGKFLKDVASFANSVGGDIIYGVDEDLDEKGRSTGSPKGIVGLHGQNLDAEIRRLASVVQSGLDPTVMPRVELKVLETSSGPVLLLRVPRSFTGPHMVRDGRFYARHDSQNLPMDATELRHAFAGSEAWVEKVERFRDERLRRLRASDRLPVPVLQGERLVVHVLPFSAFTPSGGIDVRLVKERRLEPPDSHVGSGTTFNLEGVCVQAPSGGVATSYVQFFRQGLLEVVAHIGRMNEPGEAVYLNDIEDHFLNVLRYYAPLLMDLGAPLPMGVMLSVIGVAGCEAVYGRQMFRDPRTVAVEDIVVPPFMLEDLGADPPTVARDALYTLWQACGYERSFSYDEQGNWCRQSG